MNVQESLTYVTPTPTTKQITPLKSDNLLDPPFQNKAIYDAGSAKPQLQYSCSVMLPVEIDWSQVTVYQFYAGNGSQTLEFYFVYDKGGVLSGNFKQYDLTITALDTDGNGNKIPLDTIQNVFSLIENMDPKTSRGIKFPVVKTGQP